MCKTAARLLQRLRYVCALLAIGWLVCGAPARAQTADLSQIYPGGWSEWARDFDELVEALDRYLALRTKPLQDPAVLLEALSRWEAVHLAATKVEGYVRLRLDLDSRDGEARARQARLDEVDERWYGEASAWLETALLEVGEPTVLSWMDREEGLARYRFHLRRVFHGARHTLSEGEERLAGLSNLFARQTTHTHAALGSAERLRIEIELTSGEAYAIDPTRARTMLYELGNPADRQRAQRAWLETLARDAAAHAALLDGVVGQRRFVAEARGFEGALEAALYADAIPLAAIDRLIETAQGATGSLRRYHRLRGRALGLMRYGAADRFVPLARAETGISFDQARELIVASAAPLGVEVQELLESAFADGWIDAVDRPGKAFKSKLSPVLGAHPYVIVTFDGTTVSLLNLAHELGHAVHRVIADRAQPWVDSRYSTLTAETVASVHELVLVEHLLTRAETPADRVAALDFAIQSLLRTFYRTVVDADFELAAHTRGRALTADGLAAAFRDRLVAYHGDSLDLEPWDGHAWLQTPHFFTAPLYMPRYGLAYAAAIALTERMTSGETAPRERARRRYIDLLRAGGNDFPTTLLAHAGADLESAETLAAAPQRLDRLVHALEQAVAARDTGSAPVPRDHPPLEAEIPRTRSQ